MAEYIVSTYPKHSPEYDDAEMFLAVLSYFHNNLDQFKDRMEARGWSVG